MRLSGLARSVLWTLESGNENIDWDVQGAGCIPEILRYQVPSHDAPYGISDWIHSLSLYWAAGGVRQAEVTKIRKWKAYHHHHHWCECERAGGPLL